MDLALQFRGEDRAKTDANLAAKPGTQSWSGVDRENILHKEVPLITESRSTVWHRRAFGPFYNEDHLARSPERAHRRRIRRTSRPS